MRARGPLEQHIAMFGESGSGKTVLVSSFYGAAQEPDYRKRSHMYVVAEEIGLGNRLQQNYLGMKNSARPPEATRFAATSYSFSIKLKDPSAPKSKSGMFHALRLVWHDYPGEWFEEGQSSPEEAERRINAFKDLMRSDVAVLLVDAQRLLENAGEEERYLKSLFTNYHHGLLSLWDGLGTDREPVVEFPRIWVLALSKSDLMPELDVFGFRDLLIEKVSAEMEDLRAVIADLVEEGDALSVGEDFLLLSSAKFAPGTIDVSERIGLELILPMAAALPLERHMKWIQARQIGGNVAEHLIGGLEGITKALGGIGALAVDLGKGKNKLLSGIGLALTHFGSSLSDLARFGKNKLTQSNSRSAAHQAIVRAAYARFDEGMLEGEEGRVLLRSDR